jgi:hypothetical protein
MRAGRAVLICFLGFALGYAARLPALRQLREDRDDARRALAAVGPRLLVQSPPAVERDIVAVYTVPDAPVADMPDVPAAEETVTGPADRPRPERGRRGRDPSWDDPEVRQARMREFAERMRGWADESRRTFVERAALDDAQTQQLDLLIYDLNQSAAAIVAEWSAYIRQAGSWSSDYGIRFAHDLSAVLVAAYDAMDETLGDSWRGSDGDFSLLRMLDPEVLRPMRDLQREMGGRDGLLGGFLGGRGGSPSGGDRRRQDSDR